MDEKTIACIAKYARVAAKRWGIKGDEVDDVIQDAYAGALSDKFDPRRKYDRQRFLRLRGKWHALASAEKRAKRAGRFRTNEAIVSRESLIETRGFGRRRMKIYVVTSGDYSDYGIRKIFATAELANEYAALQNARPSYLKYEVEEWDLSEGPLRTIYTGRSWKNRGKTWDDPFVELSDFGAELAPDVVCSNCIRVEAFSEQDAIDRVKAYMGVNQ